MTAWVCHASPSSVSDARPIGHGPPAGSKHDAGCRMAHRSHHHAAVLAWTALTTNRPTGPYDDVRDRAGKPAVASAFDLGDACPGGPVKRQRVRGRSMCQNYEIGVLQTPDARRLFPEAVRLAPHPTLAHTASSPASRARRGTPHSGSRAAPVGGRRAVDRSEIDQDFGLSDTLGVAGFPSGEALQGRRLVLHRAHSPLLRARHDPARRRKREGRGGS